MKLVNDLSFYIRLKVFQFNLLEPGLQVLKIILKGFTAINGRFSFSQQIQIRAIDNDYFHEI